MKTLLILVGKTINKHFIAGINDYRERIEHYMPFDVTVIRELKNTKKLSNEQQKEREGELILSCLKPMVKSFALLNLLNGYKKNSILPDVLFS